ncbi:MAG: hypothetical protein JNK32_10755 [Anaerolineales bacterium]|nr:hypothetical protein [Anaerolineales bacterium]
MKRKILAGTLIGVSSLILLASLVGVVLAWVYNTPLTLETEARLDEVEAQLSQIQTDLQKAKAEVDRALRMIQSAEDALAKLTQQTTGAKEALEQVNQTLDDELLPGLENTRERITEVRGILQDLRGALEGLNSLPFIQLDIPGDELLANLITEIDSLDGEIAGMQDLAQRASVFLGDTSYLLGGDFQTSKENLQDLLQVLEGYDSKLTGWLAQIAMTRDSAPHWIDNASTSLTVALLWSAFSQLGLILHGLSIWQGGNPLDVLRRKPELAAE